MVYVKMGNRLSVRSKYLFTLDVTVYYCYYYYYYYHYYYYYFFFFLIELLHTSNSD